MKRLPTVVASLDGDRVLRVEQFDGAEGVQNRDAFAFYFSGNDLQGDRVRFGIMFSGTVRAISPEAFGLPIIADREASFVAYSLAALGDYVDSGNVLSPTLPGMPAQWIECFSPHFQEWADRDPVDDASLEQYLRVHLYQAWLADQESWELDASDLLRLGRTMTSLKRILRLGEGDLWEIEEESDEHVRLKPTKQLVNSARAGSSAATLPTPTSDAEEKEAVSTSDEPPSFTYIDEARLADLRRIESSNFDLRKVIALCEELNICYRSQCYHAVAALTRALMDHIPPIFGYMTFVQVASNYAAGKSLKSCLARLQGSARDIGDAHLHQAVRRTESLPTRTQVNFSHDLDMLLAEIIRRLEDEGG